MHQWLFHQPPMAYDISHQNNLMTIHSHIGITSAKNLNLNKKRAITSAQSISHNYQIKRYYYLDTHFPIQIIKLGS